MTLFKNKMTRKQYTILQRAPFFQFDDKIICKCYDEESAKLIVKALEKNHKSIMLYIMEDERGVW